MLFDLFSGPLSPIDRTGQSYPELLFAAVAFTAAAYFGARSSLNVERALDHLMALETKRFLSPASPDLVPLPSPSSSSSPASSSPSSVPSSSSSSSPSPHRKSSLCTILECLAFLGIILALLSFPVIIFLPNHSAAECFIRILTAAITVFWVIMSFEGLYGALTSTRLERECVADKDDSNKLRLEVGLRARAADTGGAGGLLFCLFFTCIGVELFCPTLALALLDAFIAFQTFKSAQKSESGYCGRSTKISGSLAIWPVFMIFNVIRIVSADRTDSGAISTIILRTTNTFLCAWFVGIYIGTVRRFEAHRNAEQLPWVDSPEKYEKVSDRADSAEQASKPDEQLDKTWSVPVDSTEPLTLPPPLTRRVLAIIPACYLIQMLCKLAIASPTMKVSGWTIETLAHVDGIRTAPLLILAYLAFKISRLNRDQEERDALWAYTESWTLTIIKDKAVDGASPTYKILDERDSEASSAKDHTSAIQAVPST